MFHNCSTVVTFLNQLITVDNLNPYIPLIVSSGKTIVVALLTFILLLSTAECWP